METQKEIEEYWKIKELKKYLIILAKEDKLGCKIIKSEEDDITTKIKLMQEAEKYGRQSKEKEMIDDEIKFIKLIDERWKEKK